MDTQINLDPPSLPVPVSILNDMVRLSNFVADIYNLDDCEVSITITDDKNIHELNRRYRHVDEPTDVLSFAFAESDIIAADGLPVILGQIVISFDHAAAQAKKYGHSLQRELLFLLTHGLLHLLGYDHIYDDERIIMLDTQRDILRRVGIRELDY